MVVVRVEEADATGYPQHPPPPPPPPPPPAPRSFL